MSLGYDPSLGYEPVNEQADAEPIYTHVVAATGYDPEARAEVRYAQFALNDPHQGPQQATRGPRKD